METRQPVKIYVTEENDSWRNVQVRHAGLLFSVIYMCGHARWVRGEGFAILEFQTVLVVTSIFVRSTLTSCFMSLGKETREEGK